MKLTTPQIESLVRRVVLELEKKNLVQFNKSRDQILVKAREIILNEFKIESQLDAEVERRMDQLEQEQGDNFQRHRMFGMLKKKMAEEKGIII